MITRWLTALGVGLAVLATGAPGIAQDAYTFVYLERDADPAYESHRAYTGLVLRDRHRPVDGAAVALRESRVLGRAAGLKFELIERTLSEGQDPAGAILGLLDEGRTAFLLDLPLEDVVRVSAALADRDLLLFNIRHGADRLREEDCSPVLFHTIPSDAMRMDALAQYLADKRWTDVLVLRGEEPADAEASRAFQRAAERYRLDVVDVRPFVLSNDPRLRDRTNVPLLTGDADYDVLFLADSVGEFGRYVPYQTQEPRPVVGSEGLVPGAWHWTWERHGAPQLNQRFDKQAHRPMTDEDWAAWAAVRAVVEAIVRTGSRAPADLRAYLVSDELTLDTYKGAPGNFRPWDHQLRQPILLHTHNAVIARAPLEGFLHQTNTLDTLGADAPESRCRMAE
jgi:ABC transporter substrate binding protein (PQQ-dependent alcohol dehydrogenase system)